MKNYIIIISISLLSGFMGAYLYPIFFNKGNIEDSIAYVKLPELQTESRKFKAYQKEIEDKYIIGQKKLDSAKIELQNLKVKIEQNPTNSTLQDAFQNRIEDFHVFENRLQAEHEARLSEMNNKFWEEVNKEIEKYGKEKGYKLILGATGNGGIMYGEENVDITNAILERINN